MLLLHKLEAFTHWSLLAPLRWRPPTGTVCGNHVSALPMRLQHVLRTSHNIGRRLAGRRYVIACARTC